MRPSISFFTIFRVKREVLMAQQLHMFLYGVKHLECSQVLHTSMTPSYERGHKGDDSTCYLDFNHRR